MNCLSPSTCRITLKDSVRIPAIQHAGNVFAGEPLCISWQETILSGVDIHISLPERCLLSTVQLQLGGGCAPGSVSIFTADKGMCLYRYQGETGEPITKKLLKLPVGENLSRFVIEISCAFSDICIENIALYGASLDTPALMPTPSSIRFGAGSFPVSQLIAFRTDSQNGVAAAALLGRKLGLTLKPCGDARFSIADDPAIPENGYCLCVTPEKITLCASDLRGFTMGAETLAKLEDGGKLPACTVEDAPFKPFRGVHLYLPAPEQLEFTKRLIEFILSPCGYNYIILEIGGAMRFDSHPEVNEAYVHAVQMARSGIWPSLPHSEVGGGRILEKAQVRELVEFARSFGIEVIPEIQSLSHVQFQTLAHPEIGEVPAEKSQEEAPDILLADIPPSDYYTHCTCPSNPKTYELVFDLMDEILDVVQPTKYVHMGHDEVYQIGVCPLCKDKDPARLFAEDILKYHSYLKQRGLTMMIWSDMLQPIGENGKVMKTQDAVRLIPKDVVLLDFIWYFHPDKDIEDHLLPEGFSVGCGNLYSSHYPRFESRIRKEGMIGGQVSAWTETSEEALAREGKLYDFLYTGQMLWSEHYCSENRVVYDAILKKRIPLLRRQLRGENNTDKKAVCLVDNGPFPPNAAVASREYALNCYADRLILQHTALCFLARRPWTALPQIAAYRVTYKDGTAESIPVLYGGNIGWWNRRQNEPLAGMYYRHNGYTSTWSCDSKETRLPDGRIACLYCYEWQNPHPEKQIVQFSLIPQADAGIPVQLQYLYAISSVPDPPSAVQTIWSDKP